ncbi:MAG TPA: tetratricopeptide repeat protein [Rhodothermales bacterium]|nr:tetratricopeptide repeat protein [Rhodothermales bacterium]
MAPPPRHDQTLPDSRRRWFVALALLLPVLLFALAEGILRIAGYGADYPLFVEVPGYESYLMPNPDVGRRYFRQSSIVPGPPHDVFLREKPDSAFRLFVQGGSTGAGFPYGHSGTFPRILKQRLIRTFPDMNVEVVNTSIAAVNSYTLLDFSGEILEQEPDAVLIYAGHNEYYGSLGVASIESPGGNALLVGLLLKLDDFRVFQALRSLLEAARRLTADTDEIRSEDATLMEEMAGETSIEYGGNLFRLGVKQFRLNLTDLLCKYRDARVPVYIGTLVANERDQAPLSSGLPGADSLEWSRLQEAAALSLASGDTLGALGKLEDLIALDTTSAGAFFQRARLLDFMGRHREARTDYREAINLDRLRFRAPEEMNTVIVEVASECGARVVDIEKAFSASSGDGIIGRELVLEHVHPNLDGYLLMANSYFDALHRSAVHTAWPSTVPPPLEKRDVLVTELDSTLASWHIRRLLNNWPFQEKGETRPDTLRISSMVDSLALDVLRNRRDWVDATASLGAYHESRGNFRSALRAALALADEQPYRSIPFLLAAGLFARQERYAAALQYYEAADQREPSLEARRGVGHLLTITGRFPAAIPWLERALELKTDDRASLYDLAIAYAAVGRHEEATRMAEKLLEVEPENIVVERLVNRLNASDKD